VEAADARRGRGPTGPTGPTPGSAADLTADAEPYDVARTICLQQLTAAPRTRAQLATVLGKRGIPDDIAEAVLTRLCDVGLIDDAAYAEAWVESRHRGRGLAKAALARELRTRGVSSLDSQAALDSVDHERELVTARQLVARRMASTRGLEPAVRVRRLAGLLARKGYPPGVVYPVVREALAADDGETAEVLALVELDVVGDDPADAGGGRADP
jgi:regulatory protein